MSNSILKAVTNGLAGPGLNGLGLARLPALSQAGHITSDNVVKAVAVIQTLWFGIQAAHHVSRGFDVTKLEITSVGYVVLNIFVYFFWWNKPLNVRFPIDVYPTKSEDKQAPSLGGASNNEQGPESQMLLQPSLPFQVRIGKLLNESSEHEPLFWVTALFLFIMSALFGAIHCLAWNSPFPTHTEHILWRVCTPIVTAAPALAAFATAALDDWWGMSDTT